MADQISIEDAQGNLKELIARLTPGSELVITDHKQPVAKLIIASTTTSHEPPRRRGGQLKGQIVIAPDFDRLPDDIAAAFGANKPCD